MSNHSIPGGGSFNARIAETKPTPDARVEGTPKQSPPHPGFKSSHRDLTPSESPTLDLPSASTISAGIAAALNRHDREQALVNGISEQEFNAGMLRTTLAKAVATSQMTETQAAAAFALAFPNLDPATLKEKS
jgi:hypothetical protein